MRKQREPGIFEVASGDALKIIQWPSQDGIDRSSHFAIVVQLHFELSGPDDARLVSEWRGIPFEVQSVFESAVNQAVRDTLALVNQPKLQAVHYQIGPMAGGIIANEPLIITLWENKDEIAAGLSALADAFAIYEVSRRVKQRLNSWLTNREKPNHISHSIDPIFTPVVIAALCEVHVRFAYHPRASLKTEWRPITQEFWGGYRSPGHPTGDMEYLITISARNRCYYYRVDGIARCSAHFMVEGKKQMALELPDLLPQVD